MNDRHPGELDALIRILERGLDPTTHHPNVAWAFRPQPNVAAAVPEMAEALALLKAIRAQSEKGDDI